MPQVDPITGPVEESYDLDEMTDAEVERRERFEEETVHLPALKRKIENFVDADGGQLEWLTTSNKAHGERPPYTALIWVFDKQGNQRKGQKGQGEGSTEYAALLMAWQDITLNIADALDAQEAK